MKAVTNRLEHMISPKSIAIIGVSGDSKKISAKPAIALRDIGYEGDVHLVNPKYNELYGFPCYESIESLPSDIDLAIVSVKASSVLGILHELDEQNVKSVALFSSGFSEIGEKGAQLEKEIRDFSIDKGIPICGPNSLGFTNLKDKVKASFSLLDPAYQDPIAFVTQSGAVGSMTYMDALDMGFGYQYFVSTGNEASVDFFDYVQYFAEKDELKVIGGYLEGARDYEKMEKAIQTCNEHDKPLVLMKVGNSKRGAEAASSHTASLAGNATIYESYLKKKNIVRVADEIELTDTLQVFTKAKKPIHKGGVAIVSISGGAGIIMADLCEKYGLPLAKLSEDTNKKLKYILPKFASIKNPVDVTAQILQTPKLLIDSLQIILEDESVESIVLYFQMTDPRLELVLPDLAKLIEDTDKRILLNWSGIKKSTKELIFQYDNICWNPNPSRTMKALANVMLYYRNHDNNKERENVITRITQRPNDIQVSGSLNEWQSKLLLENYGVSIPKGHLVDSDYHLEEKLEDITYPIVMKAVSKDIKHKSDYGLVKVNIKNKQEAITAYRNILENKETHCNEAELDGVLIEEMAPKGVEVIIGAIKDPVFGVCVMFGLGGIFVEIMKDVVVLPAPLTKEDARYMVQSIKGYSILEGARGEEKYDIDALVDSLVRISEFCVDYEDQLIEFDINPLIVHQDGFGVTAVDGLIECK